MNMKKKMRTQSRMIRSTRDVEIMERRIMLSASDFLERPANPTYTNPGPILYSPPAAGTGGATPSGFVSDAGTIGATMPISGLTPAKMRGAYGIGNINYYGIVGDGTGQTIAIVDPYDDPGLVNSNAPSFATSDLALFDTAYGLPDPTFTKYGVTPGSGGNILNATVTTTLPTTDPSGPYKNSSSGTFSSAGEIALDVEWAHSMAPKANIVLVESQGFNYIFDAIVAASKLSGVSVISMSFGGSESANVGSASGELYYDNNVFNTAGISYVASSGDSGAYAANTSTITPQFPASATNVVAVGGTSLTVSGTSWLNETTWGNGTNSGNSGGAGGGISLYEPVPAYQSTLGYAKRVYPDISMDANPSTGVNIYDSYDLGTGTGWLPAGHVFGGTSLAAPLFAGLVAIADQGRALDSLSPLNSSGTAGGINVHTLLYNLFGNATSYAGDFHDITGGSAIATTPTYAPKVGFDLATGIGSPVGNNLVFDLSGISATLAVNQPATTNLYYKLDTSNTALIDVWVNAATPGTGTPTYKFVKTSATAFSYVGTTGNDTLTLDYSAGNFATGLASLNYNASAAGTNAIVFIGTASADSLLVTTSSINLSGGLGSSVISITNVQTISLPGGSGGNDAISVFSAPVLGYTIDADTPLAGTPNVSLTVTGTNVLVLLAATERLAALSIGATDIVTLSASGSPSGKGLVVSSFTDNGTLDLNNNFMIVHGGNYTTLNSMVATAFANDAWTGVGITSAAARNDTTHLRSLGTLLNNNGLGGTITASVKSQPIGLNDVLIKFAYFGDALVDGTVDSSDYSRIDNGYLLHTTGWYNGDFNYDSVVDGSDYTLIDNAFNTQGASLASIIAQPQVANQPIATALAFSTQIPWSSKTLFATDKSLQNITDIENELKLGAE